MAELKLISADSHVNEPGDLWMEHIDKSFRDRAPRIIENPPGQRPGAYLIFEGIPPIHMAQGSGAGKKPEELPEFFRSSTPKDMDLDGVEAEVIYTTLGFRQFWLQDAAFQRACFRVYNDVPESEKWQMVRGNAIQLYALDLPAEGSAPGWR